MKPYQLYALISMFFAGLTAVIAKAGLRNVSGDTGLAVRTAFVFVIIWLNVLFVRNMSDFSKLTLKDIMYLGISGLTTSLSWIYYYRAIKIGNVNEVAIIDKASIVITILLAAVFLQEQITWRVGLAAVMIIGGLLILTIKS